MKTTHTPGPWKIDDAEDLPLAVIEDTEMGEGIAEMGERTPRNLANARLIAAAPDCYAACELALQLIKDNWIEEHGNDQVGREWEALASALA